MGHRDAIFVLGHGGEHPVSCHFCKKAIAPDAMYFKHVSGRGYSHNYHFRCAIEAGYDLRDVRRVAHPNHNAGLRKFKKGGFASVKNVSFRV